MPPFFMSTLKRDNSGKNHRADTRRRTLRSFYISADALLIGSTRRDVRALSSRRGHFPALSGLYYLTPKPVKIVRIVRNVMRMSSQGEKYLI